MILWKINMFETTNQLGISRDFMVFSWGYTLRQAEKYHYFLEVSQGKMLSHFSGCSFAMFDDRG